MRLLFAGRRTRRSPGTDLGARILARRRQPRCHHACVVSIGPRHDRVCRRPWGHEGPSRSLLIVGRLQQEGEKRERHFLVQVQERTRTWLVAARATTRYDQL